MKAGEEANQADLVLVLTTESSLEKAEVLAAKCLLYTSDAADE